MKKPTWSREAFGKSNATLLTACFFISALGITASQGIMSVKPVRDALDYLIMALLG